MDPKSIYNYFMSSRKLTVQSFVAFILLALGLMTFIYHLYTAFFGQPTIMVYRTVSFNLFLAASFLLFPLNKRTIEKQTFVQMIPDLLCLLFIIFVQVYILFDVDGFMDRRGTPTSADIAIGTIYALIVLEATRRAAGLHWPS